MCTLVVAAEALGLELSVADAVPDAAEVAALWVLADDAAEVVPDADFDDEEQEARARAAIASATAARRCERKRDRVVTDEQAGENRGEEECTLPR